MTKQKEPCGGQEWKKTSGDLSGPVTNARNRNKTNRIKPLDQQI